MNETTTIGNVEGVTVAFVCGVIGWVFGYCYRRFVLRGGTLLADWQFGLAVFGVTFVFFAIRLVEAALFRHHVLVDGSWVYAWVTPFSFYSMSGFRAGSLAPTALHPGFSPGFEATEEGVLLVEPREHREDYVLTSKPL